MHGASRCVRMCRRSCVGSTIGDMRSPRAAPALDLPTIMAASGLVPRLLAVLIIALAAIHGSEPKTMSVELFAGCHSVTNGVKGLGFPAVGLDFSTVSDFDDITTSAGFLRALLYVMKLYPGGLLWAAPPCSSWVWVLQKSESESVANDVRFLNPYRFDVYFHSLIIRFRDTRAVGHLAALSETFTTSLSNSPISRLFVRIMTVMLMCPFMVGLPKQEQAYG